MDKNMTLEKRIDAELYSYQGRMSVFVLEKYACPSV